MTTTTGGAAKVLDWMEEWLQTEWPDLDVQCTSVTEQWATIAVVGPEVPRRDRRAGPGAGRQQRRRSRSWRSATPRLAGCTARVCRICFSGELAYEVNVAAWYGPRSGKRWPPPASRFGITPYGTETMHVLRAEKGYPIIGQDTDGTVTPQDLGMDWVVSKEKPTSSASGRSPAAENLSPLANSSSVCCPSTPRPCSPRAARSSRPAPTAYLPPPPVPMLGHVTSSYRSAEFGRPFALALVKGGHARIGETLHVPVDGTLVAVEVTSSVLVDPEGARRDG